MQGEGGDPHRHLLPPCLHQPQEEALPDGGHPNWYLVSFHPYQQLAVSSRLNGQKVIFPHSKWELSILPGTTGTQEATAPNKK